MKSKTIYLIKFPNGYYAKKQPNFDWSFTDDIYLANQYSQWKTAVERGEWSDSLMKPYGPYEIECYVEQTELIRKILK